MTFPKTPIFLSFLLSIIGFFFIAEQVPWLSSWSLGLINRSYYIGFFFIGVALLWSLYQNSKPVLSFFIKYVIIYFLPIVSIIILGLIFSHEFHYLVYLFVGIYTIILFGFVTYRLVLQRQLCEQISIDQATILAPLSWHHPNNRFQLLFVIGLTCLFFCFGFHNLTRFAAVDEPLWLDGRIGKFWKHLSEQTLDKTLISDKPGITIAITTGPGLFFVEPKNYRETRYEFEARRPGTNIEDLYLAFRLPLLIVITLLLPFFYILLVPLVGSNAALFGYSAIVLSPILIGISKIVNPDSLLWIFAPLSLLAYFVFLEKRRWRFLALSGVFFGLALLTKYVANILIVYFFALSFLYPAWKNDEKFSLNFLLKVFFIWLGIGLTTLYLFVPAFWIKPSLLLSSTLTSQAFEKVAVIFIGLIVLTFVDQIFLKTRFSTALLETLKKKSTWVGKIIIGACAIIFSFVLINSLFSMPWIDFGEVLTSPKNSKHFGPMIIFLTNFYPLIFGSAPLVLLGVTSILWQSWKTRDQLFQPIQRFVFFILFFILLYSFGSTINGVILTNRYQIMVYPLFALLGGIGLYFLIFNRLRLSYPHLDSQLVFRLFFGVATAVLILSPLFTPFPLSYANILLPNKYSIDVKDMGAGSYEAAQYLNRLSHARETAIWTDKSGVCKFYVGPCFDGFNFAVLKEHQIHYLVLSSGRESRTHNRFVSKQHFIDKQGKPILLNTYYHREDSLYEIRINGRSGQSVKIFPVNF